MKGRAVGVKEKVRRTSAKMSMHRRRSSPPSLRVSGTMTLMQSQWSCYVMRVHRPEVLRTGRNRISLGLVVRPKSV